MLSLSFSHRLQGGYDQHLPILVSRVAPNTPADTSIPKLNEGDQVLSVNGKDVSGLSHDEVVSLIRSTKDNQPELVLLILPNGKQKTLPPRFFFTFLATPRTTSSRSKHAFPKIARDDIKRRMLHIAHRDTERRDAPNQALFYSCAAYFNCYRVVNVFEHVKRRFSSMPFFFILVSSRCFQSRC